MNNSQKAYELGQSLWYDNIERKLLDNGELKRLIDEGLIYGVTSNPSIFHNAISNSSDYDGDLVPLAKAGKSAHEIFDALSVEDIQRATDLFMPIYEQTNGGDGYVSLEVNPEFAADTGKTCDEAKRLWGLVGRPNLMVKIPATKEGILAIQRSIADGINVNVTLIFSRTRYEEVMNAYLTGLEERLSRGEDISGVASVASFFISRIDSNVDNRLEKVIAEKGSQANLAEGLLGKIAIANAKLAYQLFRKITHSERFQQLKSNGARVQRPLWASTSTKNPSFPDTLYIDALIGTETVNTVPPNTLDAFNDHGEVAATLPRDLGGTEKMISDLHAVGISLAEVTEELEDQGVEAFSKAFRDLLETIEERRLKAL